jgi:hypothetical protein
VFPYRSTAPQDYYTLAGPVYVIELVSDEEHGYPAHLELIHQFEEALGVCPAKNSRWFVEKQDPGVAPQRLEDLHPLLPCDIE